MNGKRKEDPRAVRTKQILKDTVLSLVQKKSAIFITVKEICESAHINRGTFYLHYADLYELLEEIIDDLLRYNDNIENYQCSLRSEKYDCPYGICDKLSQNIKYGAIFFDEMITDMIIKKIAEYSKDKYIDSLICSCNLTRTQAEKIFYFQLNGCLAVNKQVFINKGKDWEDTRDLIGEFIQSGLRHFMK